MSKQAFYKRLKAQQKQQIDHQKLIKMVKDYRKKVGSKTGGIKLHTELKQDFVNANIKIGRDKFYRFLRLNNLLIPKTKNYITTTNSNHMYKKYKNLVKDHVPTRPEQLWVSDITYIKTQYGHNYLAIVTDAYSKQIMGYKLDNHMRTSLCTDALAMAIKNRKYPNQKLIHHSDRGFQYCNPKYKAFAEDNNIIMSMTEQYDPYENAVAERINRTLKYEYGLKQTIKNTELAQKMTEQAVYIYNNLRTHFSLELRKPAEVHLNPNIKYKSYRKNKVNLPELTI
ncbi:IS3 family transposase [Urechidicola croceus]|uniref:Transposase n=1 Tax=Urechidicola croceus TaxID=1850246 RepID=A0A1D8P475_9FLAO|nr:IS3 family transposase [Urechidicola croceus]AOW19318.1 transposase [Urechidicola croceus]AOW19355.1 transposase [Urechidicola croceus]AOW19367.1 transposase [Urechidicola croceus]AOW19380.1 transposase [Urechidicola croceus]AOW20738.1 transposase [Urechidicola croceus]